MVGKPPYLFDNFRDSGQRPLNDPETIFTMTRHAAFVWPSYAVTAVLLIGLVVTSVRALKRTASELERAEKAKDEARQ